MARYPIGQQDFKTIREEGYIYVDKTDYIRLLLENQYYFLSRPRRFGKSLFLSTLYYFFRGERELFKGLAIDSFNEWKWERHPVIRIDLNGGDYTRRNGLEEILNYTISRHERDFELPSTAREEESPYGKFILEGISLRFRNLIYETYRKFGTKVVVLVDEYDKPLLDAIDNEGMLEANRNVLGPFYSVLKSCGECIRMVFLTGVTRFAHLNIFSGFNNLKDISLSDDYSAICGITEREMIENFTPGIQTLADSNDIGFEKAVERLKEYYDGYHFTDRLVDVYNPYSLITALSERKIKDIWAYTGNSNYLLRILRKGGFNLFELEGAQVSSKVLMGINPEYTDPLTLLYQSGYLTIKALGRKADRYILGLPNHEVSSALYEAIVPFYTHRPETLLENDYDQISGWMARGDVETFLVWLKEFFARVTYDVKLLPISDRMRQESDFQFVVFCILSLSCGLNKVRLEEATSNGRIDLTVETESFVYIFEFKMGSDPEEAMDQIRRKGYADRWAADGREIILAGVCFSPKSRGVTDFSIARLKGQPR